MCFVLTGQQETFLNVRGHESLIDSCRRCFASLFTDRAISYRQTKKFDHFAIGLSIGVQLVFFFCFVFFRSNKKWL